VIRFNINNQNDLQSTPLQQQQQHRIDLNKVKPNSDFVIMEKSVSDSSLALNSKYNNNNIRPHALLKYNFSNTNNSNSESTFNSPSFESSVSPASAANSSSIPFSQTSPPPPPLPPPPPPPPMAPLSLRPFRTKTANATTHLNNGCFYL